MNELTVIDNKLELLEDGIKQIKKFQKAKLQLDFMEEELKKMFLEKMEETGIDKYTSPDGTFKVTYVPETIAKRFDSTKFKKEHEDLYEEYQTELTRKAYVRMS